LIECILHLGSNKGYREINIELAEVMISNFIGKIALSSSSYSTSAWGLEDQGDFINKALSCDTELTPTQVLKQIGQIENKLGRIRNQKWGPRIIDIDIIFYGDKIIENHRLKIPHPELTNRNFVLIPLLDICPGKVHPVFNKTIKELASECRDKGIVKKIHKPNNILLQ